MKLIACLLALERLEQKNVERARATVNDDAHVFYTPAKLLSMGTRCWWRTRFRLEEEEEGSVSDGFIGFNYLVSGRAQSDQSDRTA